MIAADFSVNSAFKIKYNEKAEITLGMAVCSRSLLFFLHSG